MELMCDFNSPFYLNETQSTFKLRFFVSIGGIDALFPTLDGNYPIHVLLEIADGSEVLITEEQDIILPPSGIAYALFDNVELSGSGITELTSYQLRVSCYSGLVTATTQYAIYSTALYYVLKNFNEFMTDIRNLDDIIESITNGSDISSGTYDTLREIMGLTKTKINNLESSLETLRAEYPEDHDGIYDQCTKAIKQFRDYFVWLSAFMDKYAPETVAADPALFTQFKGYILDLRFWYSDAFTQYNSYIAGLKGEDQISDDIGNITKGYEEDYQKKYNADRNNDLNKFLPALVVLFALLIAFIISAIAYYGFRRKLSSPVLCVILAVAVFGISAIVLYLFLLSISGAVLNWFYLGGS
jgi:hypothetical protein